VQVSQAKLLTKQSGQPWDVFLDELDRTAVPSSLVLHRSATTTP
jgi:hypothetical protein